MQLAVQGSWKRTSSAVCPASTPPSILDVDLSETRMPGLVDSPMASEVDNTSRPKKLTKEDLKRELERVQREMAALEKKAEGQGSGGQKRKRLDELTDVDGGTHPVSAVRKVPKIRIKQQGQLVRTAELDVSGERKRLAVVDQSAPAPLHDHRPASLNPPAWEEKREVAGPSGRLPSTPSLQSQYSLKSPKVKLFEPVSVPGTWELLEECKQVMQHLSKHKSAGAFRQPVDVVALGLPNYYDRVPEPMDMSLVRDRLARGYYTTPAQFARDVRLIWSNCILFNGPENHYSLMAKKMSQSFEAKFAPLEKRMRELGLTSLEEEDERVAQKKEEMEAERQAKMLEDKQKALDRYYELEKQKVENEAKSKHRAEERAQQRAAAAAAAAAMAEQARLARENAPETEAQAEQEQVVRSKREASKRASETVHRFIAEQRGPMPKLEAPSRRHKDKKRKPKREAGEGDDHKQTESKSPKESKPKGEKQPKRERRENGVNKSGLTYAERSQLPMTTAEKQKLALDIQKLPQEKMEQVADIVSKYVSDSSEEIVLDVNAMDHKTLWELRRFVSNFLKSRTKWLRRVERREKEGYTPRPRAPRKPKPAQEEGAASESGSESGSSDSSGSDSGSGSGSESDSERASGSGSGSGSDSDVDVGDEHAQSEVGPIQKAENGVASSDGTSRLVGEKAASEVGESNSTSAGGNVEQK